MSDSQQMRFLDVPDPPTWTGTHPYWPKKLAYMQRVFGEAEGDVKCGDCIHFRRIERSGAKTYFKCALYGDSRSEATDWRVNWAGCGLWEEAEGD